MILTPSPFLLLWKLLRFVVFALFTGVTANSLFLSYNSVMLNVTHTHTLTHTHTHTHTCTHMHAHTHFSFLRATQMMSGGARPDDIDPETV